MKERTDGEVKEAFGSVLREARKEAELTRKEVCEGGGMSEGYLPLLEKGRNQPTIAMLRKVAEGLGMETVDLVERLEEKLRQQE